MKSAVFSLFLLLACFVLFSATAACLSPTLDEESPDVNLPPVIDSNFVTPVEDVVHVETSDTVHLAVESLLDPNPEEVLYYAFIGERSGIIEQATATRHPTDERYRDAMYLFERIEIEIDPCGERLRDHGDELIRLFVSDRPFQRVTQSAAEPADDGYVASHRWLLRFRQQLCP